MTSRTTDHDSSAAAVLAVAPEEKLVGTRVHKYEIVRVIGRGGMGTVYEALNTTIGKRVAMKFVDATMARNKDAVARFQREAQAASAVESAHIVEIFDSGYADDGVPYIVMELLRGEDLGHRIKRCGRLELPEALHVASQLLRGLHRAHQAGIVHRDLKPDNVFLVDRDDDANFAKILDFGISKVRRAGETPVNTLTRQGTVLGTPFYMSPEQAQAQPDVDGRADLWSVGAILYECLSGRPPYRGTTYEQVIVNICMYDADDVRLHNPAVPEPIALVIAKALARERDERFATAREFLDALKGGAGGLVSSRPELIGDDSTPRHALRATPRSGKTPIRVGGTPDPSDESASLGPTIAIRPERPSRVGWATSGREAARREKRTFLAVGVSALLAGVLGAFLFVRSRPPAVASATPPAMNAEVSVQLVADAPGARFLVEGKPLQGGVLRGERGRSQRVRVEADGYTPIEREVPLDGEGDLIRFAMVLAAGAAAPTIEPAVTASAAVAASATAAPAETKKPQKAAVNQGAAVKQPAPKATGAAPTPTGVAGGLKLKTD